MKTSRTKKKGLAESPAARVLRRRAEKKLRQKRLPNQKTMSEADVRALVHELQVHQIELEMQNEDLLRAQTAAQEAADRFTELFDFAPVAYFVLNQRGLIRQLNLAAASLLGLDRKRVVGQLFKQYVEPACHAVFAALCRSVREGQTKQTCELKLLHHRGGFSDVLIEATGLEDAPDGGVGWRFTVVDISQRKQAENALLEAHAVLEQRVQERTAELQTANAQLQREVDQRLRVETALRHAALELERSNRDLDQFAYIASHDLQEPLRAVEGYVKLIELRFPKEVDEKLREYIAGAADGAQRMAQLITDLLEFSRVETYAPDFEPADLSALLDSVLNNFQARIKLTQATVTHDPMPTLVVRGPQILQVFQNLLNNAFKFHSDRPPAIHIGARQQNGKWVFFVRDNGIGIDPQFFERIFQVFQRLHSRSVYPGTGMGLALAKKIVECHGGKMWVESKPGEGSTFFFTLPVEQAARK